MATPRKGIGTLLKMGAAASPYAPATVGLCNDITGPGLSAETYDTTSHDTVGGYTTYITGLKDAGEVTAKVFFDGGDAGHQSLISVHNNLEQRYFELAPAGLSPAVVWKFMGFITKLDFGYPVNGVQSADITIKISGGATFA